MIYITYILPGSTKGAPPSDFYEAAVKRFAQSYRDYFPSLNHKLILVNSNGGFNSNIASFFEGLDYEIVTYNGSGWDIGGHQHVANSLSRDDWTMWFSTWTYFRQNGWLEAFVEAREKYGDAIYGSTASYERHLHLRGTGIFMRCGTVQSYPFISNNKKQSWFIESGNLSLTKWYLKHNKEAYLVTPKGVVNSKYFRSMKNIYRSGDQSNNWIFDKHSDIYDNSQGLAKLKLELLANSKIINILLNAYLKLTAKS